jgi:hypothetical protein
LGEIAAIPREWEWVALRQSAGLVFEISSNAWEKGRNPLLTSSHPVEQWASHWLDFLFFAGAGGYEHDTHRPKEWRHYDCGVNSFDDVKSYKEFPWTIIVA